MRSYTPERSLASPDHSAAEQREYEKESGVVIINGLIPDFPGALSGLERGDQIVAIDGQPCQSKADLITAVGGASEKAPLRFSVRRGQEEIEIDVQPKFIAEVGRCLTGILSFDCARIVKQAASGERECYRLRHDYTDAEGRPLGTAIVDYDTVPAEIRSPDEMLEAYPAWKLSGLALINSQGQPFDILKMFNHHNVNILVDDLVGQAHGPTLIPSFLRKARSDRQDPEERESMVTRQFDNPLLFADLLHELRHVYQSHKPGFMELFDLYGAEKFLAHGFYGYRDFENGWLSHTLDALAERLPDYAAKISPLAEQLRPLEERIVEKGYEMVVTLDELLTKQGEYWNNQGHLKIDFDQYALHGLLPGVDQVKSDPAQWEQEYRESIELLHDLQQEAPRQRPATDIAKLEEQIQELRNLYRSYAAITNDPRVHTMLCWPTQIIERDADAGMLAGLRRLRQEAGINLLGKMKLPPQAWTLLGGPHWEAYQEKMEKRERNFGPVSENIFAELGIVQDEAGNLIMDIKQRSKLYMHSLQARPSRMRLDPANEQFPFIKSSVADVSTSV